MNVYWFQLAAFVANIYSRGDRKKDRSLVNELFDILPYDSPSALELLLRVLSSLPAEVEIYILYIHIKLLLIVAFSSIIVIYILFFLSVWEKKRSKACQIARDYIQQLVPNCMVSTTSFLYIQSGFSGQWSYIVHLGIGLCSIMAQSWSFTFRYYRTNISSFISGCNLLCTQKVHIFVILYFKFHVINLHVISLNS